MPHFEKLPESEVEKLRKRKTPREGLLDPYFAFLDTMNAGDWGTVALDDGESQRAVKRRLTTASKQRGMQIKYRKSDQGKILFELK